MYSHSVKPELANVRHELADLAFQTCIKMAASVSDRQAKAWPGVGPGPVRSCLPVRQLGRTPSVRFKIGGTSRRQALE